MSEKNKLFATLTPKKEQPMCALFVPTHFDGSMVIITKMGKLALSCHSE